MVFAIRQHELASVYMCPLHPEPPTHLPPPPHPSRSSQSTDFGCPASYIQLSLVIYFTHGSVYVSMLFSQIFFNILVTRLCFKQHWKTSTLDHNLREWKRKHHYKGVSGSFSRHPLLLPLVELRSQDA